MIRFRGGISAKLYDSGEVVLRTYLTSARKYIFGKNWFAQLVAPNFRQTSEAYRYELVVDEFHSYTYVA